MYSFNQNELSLLNNIIHKIYSIEQLDDMRNMVLRLLKSLIPYTKATFYLGSPGPKNFLERPVGLGVTDEALQLYLDEYEEDDYTNWIFISAKSMAYRETDFFTDDTREKSRYYQGIYAPTNLHYSAQLSLAWQEQFVGIISIYRPKDGEDFSDRDIFLLDLLKDHLALRLYQELGRNNKEQVTFSAEEYIREYQLTAREVEVLQLLFDGLSNDEISERLCISPNTLKKHRVNIYKKMGITNRWELFRPK